MSIRTIVADGDACSRQILRAAVTADPELSLVAECTVGSEVVRALCDHRPSLMLLDAQMPDLDSLTLAKALGAKTLAATVFLMPPGDCERRAFDAQGVGYLAKPIRDSHLLTTLRQAKIYVKSRCELGGDPNRSFDLRGSLNKDRFLIKTEGRIIFLRTEEIDWIQASANYVRVHVGSASYLHRQTITGLERHLDPARFLRIHRSAIVNIDKIRELRPWPTGEYVVLMRSGKELTLSRSYRTRLNFFVGEGCSGGSAKEDQLVPLIDEFSPKLRVSHNGARSIQETLT